METGRWVPLEMSKDELLAEVRAGRMLMKDYKAMLAQMTSAEEL
eukprot:COSAG06_NODE_23734_length_683_cov_0.859589_1_plen_43_part_01